MINVTELPEWKSLDKHRDEIADLHIRDMFSNDADRFKRFSLQLGEILLDYSRNRMTDETLALLFKLAEKQNLSGHINDLFTGHPLNTTEQQPALHTALRDKNHTSIMVNGSNIADEIQQARQKMFDFVDQLHRDNWKGVTGKPIKHIVSIGIGGSYTGPMMCCQALKDFATNSLTFHFISSVDQTYLMEVLQEIDPEKTLFIISTKSFTTLETITNSRTILSWVKSKLGEQAIKHHFVAVTAAIDKAIAFGIPQENIFPIWNWVGGRYSVWSSIGLPLALMIGSKQFTAFLDGAYAMDTHFREAGISANMPVILALLGVWNLNFLGASAHAIIPYSHRLRHLVTYLQQADMESNGKCVDLHGQAIQHSTSPVIFGDEGCNGQHTFHQLFHQGQHLIPVDFILIGKPSNKSSEQHAMLVASGLSQADALMLGNASESLGHRIIPGNKPSNILFLDRITPFNLGALLALYEHKIFVQGIIWGINSFDQWGVELGKQLLPAILDLLQNEKNAYSSQTASMELIRHYHRIQES